MEQKTRDQVEKEIKDFIGKNPPDGELTMDMIKQWVYEEDGDPMSSMKDFQNKVFACFELNGENLNEITQIIMDAWNYFPHRSLGDKSPQEVAEEAES